VYKYNVAWPRCWTVSFFVRVLVIWQVHWAQTDRASALVESISLADDSSSRKRSKTSK